MLLSDEGPTLETLDSTIYMDSTPNLFIFRYVHTILHIFSPAPKAIQYRLNRLGAKRHATVRTIESV